MANSPSEAGSWFQRREAKVDEGSRQTAREALWTRRARDGYKKWARMENHDWPPGITNDVLLSRLRENTRFTSRYQVQSVLGRGGMALVARARQVSTGRDVAIKVLLGSWEPEVAERFLREGRLLAKLRHPNILQLFDQGFMGGISYIVMELAPAGSLRDELRASGALSLARVSEVMQPCLRALAACHREGVVHRDLKPDNILFGEDHSPRLADFGLAILEGMDRLTARGERVGTLRYMAPEVLVGQSESPASDIYAMGVILYELLVGDPPYLSRDVAELTAQIARARPRPLGDVRQDLPVEVIRLVTDCLGQHPRSRPDDAENIADAVANWSSPVAPSSGSPRHVSPDERDEQTVALRPPALRHAAPAVRGRARVRWVLAGVAGLGLAFGGWWSARVTWPHGPIDVPPPSESTSTPFELDAVAEKQLRSFIEAADRTMAGELVAFASALQKLTISPDGTDARDQAKEIAVRAGQSRRKLCEQLAELRGQRGRGRQLGNASLLLLVRGAGQDVFHWWLLESCRRIISESKGSALAVGELGTGSRQALVAHTEGLALMREFEELAREAGARCAVDSNPDGGVIALLLDSVRGVARCASFTEWDPASSLQMGVISGSFLRRLVEAARLERRPVARALVAAWTWGSAKGSKTRDRYAGFAIAADVRALGASCTRGRDALEAFAARIVKEAGH